VRFVIKLREEFFREKIAIIFYNVKIIQRTFKTIKMCYYTDRNRPIDLFPNAD